ncbi:Ig-like domain-containing protein, partial [bacterium]|nr:Ig-like domain-containing protein [bacterium]
LTSLFTAVPVGYFVTATASHHISSDPAISETSEFSACAQIQPPEAGLHCQIYTIPSSPIIGENVIGYGYVYDENDIPVPDLPVTFRIQTPYGENIQAEITDADGGAQTPPFYSNYPAKYFLSMEGPGFSCNTSVEFTFCLPPGILDKNLSVLTEHGEELLRIRIADPILDQLTAQLYREVSPQFPDYSKTGSIKLTPSQRDSAISLLDLYARKASPALNQKLSEIRNHLQR